MSRVVQRVRDPLHGLIEFDDSELESVLWSVVQTRPFQRLRRIKQLGFSELVYPGATHTRFAHSLGTFHVARQLVKVIGRAKGSAVEESKIRRVLAASLVHDLGHGPFSHAFEFVAKRLRLGSTDHERWSERLICEGEVAEVLNRLGSGFASDVASVIGGDGPANLYEAVVSSQFDADRLDYMQRDRLMTGTQHGAIDFAWLLANLELGAVATGVDDAATALDSLETFVLGPKAVSAAETYVLGLLQLYRTVYYHKATRGLEKLFTELLLRVFQAVVDGNERSTGLPSNHPLVRFGREPEVLEHYVELDDFVVWGALPLMAASSDGTLKALATRVRDRKLYKCLDISAMVRDGLDATTVSGHPAYCKELRRKELRRKEPELKEPKRKQLCPHWSIDEERAHWIQGCCITVRNKLEEWKRDHPERAHDLLLDEASRVPYKRVESGKGPLNQIRIRETPDGSLVDIASRSSVVRAIPKIELVRAYVNRDDSKLCALVENAVREAVNDHKSHENEQS